MILGVRNEFSETTRKVNFFLPALIQVLPSAEPDIKPDAVHGGLKIQDVHLLGPTAVDEVCRQLTGIYDHLEIVPELTLLMEFVCFYKVETWTIEHTHQLILDCGNIMLSDKETAKSAGRNLWKYLVDKKDNFWLELAFESVGVSKDRLYEHTDQLSSVIYLASRCDRFLEDAEHYCRRPEPQTSVEDPQTSCETRGDAQFLKELGRSGLPNFSSSTDVDSFRELWNKRFTKAFDRIKDAGENLEELSLHPQRELDLRSHALQSGDLDEEFLSPEAAHRWIEDACHVAEQWKNKGISVPSVSDVEKLVEECVKSICQGEASESIWRFVAFLIDPREIHPCLQGLLDPIFSRYSRAQISERFVPYMESCLLNFYDGSVDAKKPCVRLFGMLNDKRGPSPLLKQALFEAIPELRENQKGVSSSRARSPVSKLRGTCHKSKPELNQKILGLIKAWIEEKFFTCYDEERWLAKEWDLIVDMFDEDLKRFVNTYFRADENEMTLEKEQAGKLNAMRIHFPRRSKNLDKELRDLNGTKGGYRTILEQQ